MSDEFNPLQQELLPSAEPMAIEPDLSVMEPDIMQLLSPLLTRRKALAETYGKQFDDYNRTAQRVEESQFGGGMTPGQGLASVLVGLLPTLVAGAFGGKRAAGIAAGSGVQGMGVYQNLQREQQKADLQRLLGLGRNQQQLLAQTQREMTGIDRQAAQLATNRQRDKERNENSDRDRALRETLGMLGVQLSADRNEIAKLALLGRQQDTAPRPEFAQALDLAEKGEDIPEEIKKGLTSKERQELREVKKASQRDAEETRRVNQAISSESAKVAQEWKRLNGEQLLDEASAIGELKLFLQNPSAIIDSAMKRQLARAQGEKGVLSNQDIQMTVGDTMASDVIKARNYILNGATSSMTDAQRKAINQYLDAKANAISGNIEIARDELKGKLSEIAPQTLGKKSIDDLLAPYGTAALKRIGKGPKTVSEIRKELEESRKRTEALMQGLNGG